MDKVLTKQEEGESRQDFFVRCWEDRLAKTNAGLERVNDLVDEILEEMDDDV